jgi:aromatic ring-opening dioxygenase catalytic subunit (LigB family)
MYYDYSGFPEHTYRVRYDAPGAPEVARQARELLLSAGFRAELDPDRGFDHATFTLMQPMRPEADVSVVQMSIRTDLDAEAHLLAGQALAPLRDKEILILGSGMTYHNLRHLRESGHAPSRQFNDWLISALDGADSEARNRALLAWREAPGALIAQPEPDHLLPLMVAAGAGVGDRARLQFRQDDFCGHIAISSYRFG